MTREQLLQKVKELTAEQLGCPLGDITDESEFVDLGADSLDMVELVMIFEEEFGISIPDEDVDRFITIQTAVNYISGRKGE